MEFVSAASSNLWHPRNCHFVSNGIGFKPSCAMSSKASKLASCYSCYKRLVIWKLSINIIELGWPTISSWMAQQGSKVYISCLIVIAPMEGVLCRFIEQPLMLMLEWRDWHNIFYPIAKDFFSCSEWQCCVWWVLHHCTPSYLWVGGMSFCIQVAKSILKHLRCNVLQNTMKNTNTNTQKHTHKRDAMS